MSNFDALKLLELNAHKLWAASLSAHNTKLFHDLNKPSVGDLVLEITTIHSRQVDGFRMGRLTSITFEDMELSDDVKKDYGSRGEPLPKEKVFTIELPNGNPFRWTNARFIKVLERL